MTEDIQLPPEPANQIGVQTQGGSVGRGVLIGLGVTVAALIVGAPLVVPDLVIGLIQLAWVIPMVNRYRNKAQPETAKGLIIFAAIVGLLNASCWGVLVIGLSTANFH